LPKPPHRDPGGGAGTSHGGEGLRQPSEEVLLVDLPVGLDEILRDQEQLLGVIRGRT
jgi:hypothetical protein